MQPIPIEQPDAVSEKQDHWRRWVFLLWLAACACMLVYKWNAIHWFALGDTDDNIRFDQVTDWLNGQGWYDLRQYRLNPPGGASIHWSRLCDLPIAAMIVTLKPIFGWVIANKTAVAIAPMIPMLLAMYAGAFTVRQLVHPSAYALGCAIMLCGQSTLFMWMPLRIDHHGWQLAFLICTVAGLADPKPVRGGATVGVTSALSMAIGLEMLPYIAFSAAILALHWAWDAGAARRLRSYVVTLGIGTALSFVIFASNDNWRYVCDALSPVWLTIAVLGSVLLGASSYVPGDRRVRFALVIVSGAIVAATYALAFPKCMGQLEGMSPELKALWFSHVKEARPLYKHPYDIALPILALPAAGLIGGWLAMWRARGTALAAEWAPVTVFGTFAVVMLVWQTRFGPSAQLLAVPGATALGWAFLPRLSEHRLMIVRTLGVVLGFLAVSGLWMYFALQGLPVLATPWRKPATVATARPGKAPPNHSGWCFTIPALRPIEALPPQTMFTFVDFGPRLITLTHHSAIAGPYHRNGDAILDVQHAFRGSADTAHAIILRHHATMLLLCPGMPESTIYQAEAPGGFYMQLMHGQVPAWLAPMSLPKDSPFKLWRVAG